MTISAGTRLGPYEVLSPLGAGGMGEVYRARDTRLGRDVAIKILPQGGPASSEERARFRREAKTISSLNHPHICVLHDIGQEGDTDYLVMELVEGETLARRVARGPLPPADVLRIGAQIADALDRAHRAGVVHRDLKPGNVMLTKRGAKLMDFGLAREVRPARRGADETVTMSGTHSEAITEKGMIVGTFQYMAPEQLEGLGADARSDIWALGCVLYEMAIGKRAFEGATPVSVISAIMRDEPRRMSELAPLTPPALERVVRQCLAKDPDDRWQSAADLKRELLWIAETGSQAGVGPSKESEAKRRRRRAAWIGSVAILALVAAASGVSAFRAIHRPQPSFERLTFRRGTLSNARFSPGGVTLVYSAAWDGQPMRVYSTRLDSRESSPLPFSDARLLAVSSSGNLAIAVGSGNSFAAGAHTTLASVPLAGGAPREMAENVSEADWSPDGRDLVVVHTYADRTALEYPAGKAIWQTPAGIVSPRISPRGDAVAFVELDSRSDFSRGYVAVADRAGHVRRLTGLWETIQGVAWGPHGDEVWFTAVHTGSAKELWAVSLRGRERLLLRTPGGVTLFDVSRDGKALVSQDSWRMSLLAQPKGGAGERDLSWQDITGVAGMSPDGRRLVFTEYSEAYGEQPAIGMRSMDGSAVVHLGDGYAGGLSPDGKWVVAIAYGGKRHTLSLLPTGAGQSKQLDPGPVKDYDWSSWAPDGQRVLFSGIEAGHAPRSYVQDVSGGPPRAFTPEGVPGMWRLVTPDSKYLMAALGDSLLLFPLDGGAPRRLQNVTVRDDPIQWLSDEKSLLVSSPRNSLPVHVWRLELSTGKRVHVRDLMPPDAAGVTEIVQIIFTPDAQAWAYSYRRILSDLYLVKGLS